MSLLIAPSIIVFEMDDGPIGGQLGTSGMKIGRVLRVSRKRELFVLGEKVDSTSLPSYFGKVFNGVNGYRPGRAAVCLIV